MERSAITIPPRVRFVMGAAWVFRHWLELWLLIFTVFNILPYLTPVLIESGLRPLADAIYNLYGLIGHQMAHRSFFVFGEQWMYKPDELPITLIGEFLPDSSALRQFIGTEQLGWKLAWSDRLLSLFGSALITSYVYRILRQREGFRPLSLGWMLILTIPLIIDGTTHYNSDFNGVTAGFRWDNAWLATLTGNLFPDTFYVGDNWGSFNSIMRIITGILFGIGLWSWGLGRVDRYLSHNAIVLDTRIAAWWQRQETTSQSNDAM